MAVHTGTVVAHQWLGHKRCGLPVSVGNVQDAVLQNLHLVCFGNERVESNANFTLPRSADFVVMDLHIEPHLLHRRTHGSADIVERIDGWNRKIAALNARSVAGVAVFKVEVRGPGRLFSIDLVASAAHVGTPFNVFEDKKLGFRAEKGGITQPRGGEKSFRPFGNAARVTVIALHRGGFDNVTPQDDRWIVSEGIQDCGAVVGHQDHVGLIDTFPAGDRGAVEHFAPLEEVLIHSACRDRDVLLLALRVGEPEIHPSDIIGVN